MNNGAPHNGNGKSNRFMTVAAARTLGGEWEQRFCELAALYNRSFTCHQFKKSEAANCWKRIDAEYHPYLLPDVTLWTAPGEHHEIKHKNAFGEYYGLEVYRWDALIWFAVETRQNVQYTIHDHDLAGGRDVKINDIDHWVTANVLELDIHKRPGRWKTFRNGRLTDEEVDGWKFHKRLFIPLQTYWDVQRGYGPSLDNFEDEDSWNLGA